MAIQTYSRKDAFTINANLNTGTRVILPLPQQLVDGHGVGYNDKALGPAMGTIMNAGAGVLNNIKSGMSVTQAGSQALVDNALPIAGGVATQAAQAAGVADPISAVTGLTPNEFFTVLLTGPQYKRHQMTFTLAPRNFAEAIMIRKIIAVLNNSMAPGLELGGLLFNFPKVFQLAYAPNFNFLMKFKPAVLERMQVSYSNGSAPAFYHSFTGNPADSAPESVTISMNFCELEFWLHSDFMDEAASADDYRGSGRYDNNEVLKSAKDVIVPAVERAAGQINDAIEGSPAGNLRNPINDKEGK
jgi:hypothetical protein